MPQMGTEGTLFTNFKGCLCGAIYDVFFVLVVSIDDEAAGSSSDGMQIVPQQPEPGE